MKKRKIKIIVFILLLPIICLFVASVALTIKRTYQSRHLSLVKKAIATEFDSEEYWVDGCSLEEDSGRLSGVHIDATDEVVKKDDFLSCCYRIKNIVEEVAHSYPEYFTLVNNSEFYVSFLKNDRSTHSGMIEFENYLRTASAENVYHDTLCGVAIKRQATIVGGLSALRDIRFLTLFGRYIFDEDERYWMEIEKLLELPNLEQVSLFQLTEEECDEWRLKFEEKGIAFNES